MESATENNRLIGNNRVRVKMCGKSAQYALVIIAYGQAPPGARQNRHMSVIHSG